MEIIVSFTILFALLLLGGSFLQGEMVHLFGPKLKTIPLTSKYNLHKRLFEWAEKLAERIFNMLNTVTIPNTPKGAQSNFIYTDIHTFEG